MELRHLRYFVTVVREGGFTRAAEKLHMAQPPLSRQIQQLEEQLGVVLLDRQSRPLQPTEAGRFFYEQALNVLERVAAVVAMTKRFGHVERRRFGIGFVGSTLYGALPNLFRRFRVAFPELMVELLELSSIE
ncbi:regulatory helix-turn-helix LysR family protein [Plasticicumulans lactativorans]|uniref:Regulatory helix-turn-helix LysR family protein n=1 Tax=Plasticicumulans lactativorans TaxID=1133106 RepID=A0A4R2LAR4_9GAMM|nr:regulatory helix-turn-helix LysR family protein [Plasticicumulans lactativorans]